MLKPDLDYSNTIIYKITCNDTNITDKYVGHTTNFVQRKHAHKNTCVNEKSASYKCKLYEVIRNNGGWNNWKMEIVDFFNCKDLCEARQKEQEYFVSLNATLNSIEPFPTQKPNIVIVEKKEQNDAIDLDAKFYCEKCKYKCFKSSLWNQHLLTLKHKNFTDCYINGIDSKNKCLCSKKFKHHSSYYRHKKVCNFIPILQKSANVQPNNDIIQILINENKELRNMVLEVCNKIQEKL
jgi:hypothetical protein